LTARRPGGYPLTFTEAPLPHAHTAEAEALLDKEFPVLDRGFVRLVDYLGNDERIVAAARVSYGKGTKTVREDEVLINYLMRHEHTSPLEQVVLTFHVKLPIFVARQWIRHRTARVNEISGRYSVMKDDFYVPSEETLRTQSTVNKQGRAEQPVSPEAAQRMVGELAAAQREAYARYESMLGEDLAREVARIGLPLSLYTEWYWQIDLHNLFHFLALRLDAHAQWEIQQYAQVIAQITRAVAPIAYRAFERYELRMVKVSRETLDWLEARVGKSEDLPLELKERFEVK
jgi:thymidylate synthase (FAD)